jgi:hypothetical protein
MIRYVNICVYNNKNQSYENNQALRTTKRRLCIVLRRQRVFSVDQAGERGFARDICHKQGLSDGCLTSLLYVPATQVAVFRACPPPSSKRLT